MPDSTRRDPEGDEPELARVLAAASRGDEGAWRRVIELYGRRVYALAKSRCRRADLAEEVTQAVFATIASKLGTEGYSERGRFESWLFRIAMNRVRDEMRRLARHAEPTDPAVLGRAAAADEDRDGHAEPGEIGGRGGGLAPLRRAMERLADTDREVVELRHHGGMSFKQMADLLGEPLGTLLARHHRALRKLKEIMTADAERVGGGAGR